MSCRHGFDDASWCAICRGQVEPPAPIPLPATVARRESRCPGCGNEIEHAEPIYRLPNDGARCPGNITNPLELQGAWVCRECAIQHVELARVGESA